MDRAGAKQQLFDEIDAWLALPPGTATLAPENVDVGDLLRGVLGNRPLYAYEEWDNATDPPTCRLVETSDSATWARYLDSERRIVAQDTVDGKWVSTVFLGIDHSFEFSDPPLWYETMVFPEKDNYAELYCDRYTTRDEALAGHQRACQMVRDGRITGDGRDDEE